MFEVRYPRRKLAGACGVEDMTVFADGHDVSLFFKTRTHIRDAHVCMMHPAFFLFVITRSDVFPFVFSYFF